ncbi:MAG: hypothetical protein EAZ91_13510 [Cytophagales bacterium]|nr:MAG: hypothetical protein EAZ91_13510 [Cytophagales bacterium]
MKKLLNCLVINLFFWHSVALAQEVVRPMIWVKPADKAAILQKIRTTPWAKTYYDAFVKRVADDVSSHQADAKAYLSKMPLDWAKQEAGKIPPFAPIKGVTSDAELRKIVIHYLQTGIDCGILYYLTNDPKYGQCSADILHTLVEGLVPLKPSAGGHNGGGYLYPDDHLREAREIGAGIPILYDFAYPFIAQNSAVYDLGAGKKVPFSHDHAQAVFRTYINLALEQGIINCNWPILESPSLVGNTLALNDPAERDSFLPYYLTKNTPHQDALQKVGQFYQKHGGNWPESTNYSGAVAGLTTYLMTLLTRFDPSLHLGNQYPQIPFALTTTYYLTYPNKRDMVVFGDGHRSFHLDYHSFEMAYHLGQLENSATLKREFGALITSGISTKQYSRPAVGKRNYGAEVYNEPVELLWFSPEIEGQTKAYPLPITDELPFAGIQIQRNFSPTNNPADDLMGFVGGASFVHGHASGMNMELYGKGMVMGVKAGRSAYTTDIHENYYRLFAGHNTVIVNGSSESNGGWANLGTNRVEPVAIEPRYRQSGVSANHSFSVSRFLDDRGDGAEATQERTLALIRTSPTTAYYVDLFRSKSALPTQYHDYVYHNIGDTLLVTAPTPAFQLRPDPERYAASEQKAWQNNKKARHPGWHFFKSVNTSGMYPNDVRVSFKANAIRPQPVQMNVFIPGDANREYTSVMAPPTTDSPKAYANRPTPTLVIRQTGEAWTHPFAVVYEPTDANSNGSIQSVEAIRQGDAFKGVTIKSNTSNGLLTQYVIMQDSDEAEFADSKLGIRVKGRYAVITLTDANKLHSIYLGHGQSGSFGKLSLKSVSGKPTAAYLQMESDTPTVKAADTVDVTVESGKRVIFNKSN